LFYIAKVPVLLGKSAYIATQNSRFCEAIPLVLTYHSIFFAKQRNFMQKIVPMGWRS